jgi:hypothetical protein
MNQFLSTAAVAAFLFAGSVASAQPGTTFARLPQHSPTAHEYNAPVPSVRSEVVTQEQGQYVVQAVVIPMSLVYRPEAERAIKVAAPTKSAALSKLRQTIDAIGVPVRVVSLNFIASP